MKILGLVIVFSMIGVMQDANAFIPKHSDEYYEAIKPEVRRAQRKGAEAKIVYKVVDDEGRVVSNVTVNVKWENDYPRKTWYDSFCTDDNGSVEISEKIGGRMSCGFHKDGYYSSFDKIDFHWREGVSPVLTDGKWQPYGENRTIVLKREKNPTELSFCNWDYNLYYPPVTNVWIGLDLEKGKWCKPYGDGEHEDVTVRFSGVVFDRYSRDTTAEISFTNVPYAGFYILKKDFYSKFDTCYEASGNDSSYSQSYFLFRNKSALRMPQNQKVFRHLEKDKYMVFRTRCKVDESGKLISAHYGKISGAFYGGLMRLMFNGQGSGIYFNPVPNDTNLEDAATYKKSKMSR